MIRILILLFCFISYGQGIVNNPFVTFPTASFPPSGTVITNGEPNGGTGWVANGNSFFSTGYMTVEGTGNIAVSFDNWEIRQNDIFPADGTTSYDVNFEARAIGGATGNLQIGRGYSVGFNQTVTTSWVEYNFTMAAHASYNDLVIGGLTIGEQFEIRLISAVAN